MALQLALSNGKLFTANYLNSAEKFFLSGTTTEVSIGSLTLSLKSKSSVVYLTGVVYLDFSNVEAEATVLLQIERNGTELYAATVRPQISRDGNATTETVAFPFEFVDKPSLGCCSNNVTYEFILEETGLGELEEIAGVGTRTIAASEIGE